MDGFAPQHANAFTETHSVGLHSVSAHLVLVDYLRILVA